jgi:hypothetical protein
MLILGYMTIRNVRGGQHLRRETNAKDRQLTIMLIIQVIFISILSMPISVQKVYSQMTVNYTKSSERVLIENFFATFVVLLALMNTSTSFYLFTLAGKVFRKELKYLFVSNRRQTEVHPSAIAVTRVTARNTNFNGK